MKVDWCFGGWIPQWTGRRGKSSLPFPITPPLPALAVSFVVVMLPVLLFVIGVVQVDWLAAQSAGNEEKSRVSFRVILRKHNTPYP